MMGTDRRVFTLALAVAGVLLLVGIASSASALEVSTKAMKVVASHEYQDSNVESYAGELLEVDDLDGRGGAIAVLDTGVDDGHPTFKNAFVAGAAYRVQCACIEDTDLQGEGLNPDDGNGHGTHVASIALGRGTDDGPRGVAPGSALVDVKVASDLGSATNARIQAGIEWVMDYNKGETHWSGNTEVGVIVVAFGSMEPREERSYNDLMDAVKEAHEAGILVVAAAGNCGPGSGNVSQSCPGGGEESDQIPLPAATPEALAVGAVDDNDSIRRSEDGVAGYSSRGPNPADNASDETWRKPDVVAPGTDITAACPEGLGDWRMNCTKSGTSMAAPHVAGLAMIVRQALDEASDTEPTTTNIKRMITSTATDLGDEGWDPATGYGYVDGYEAVLEGTNDPPVSHFSVHPPDPEAGEQVTLDADESYDPDERDSIQRFIWEIGEDRTEKRPGDQPRVQVNFTETGQHEIELTVVDEHGTEDPEPFRRTIHVAEPTPDEDDEDTQPPEVEVAYGPKPVRVGQSTWFDLANSTDPDGHELVGFAWDFDGGDGFEADLHTEGPRTTRTFDQAGEHVVQVEVTDASDASTRATVTVDVQEPVHAPPRLEITNPQEGDVVEEGTVNVTWRLLDGVVDSFGVSVDQAAVDQTPNNYLEIHLSEEDRTIAVKANGPGGEDVDQVNVTVAEDESLDQASSDGGSEQDVQPNPPRQATSPGGEETEGEATDETQNPGAEPASQATDPGTTDGENEAAGPGLALALAALASAGLVASRRG